MHLELDLDLDLEKVKRKSHLRYFSLAVFHCPDPVKMRFEGPVASVLFFLFFSISHMRYSTYAIYRTCNIYRICDSEK